MREWEDWWLKCACRFCRLYLLLKDALRYHDIFGYCSFSFVFCLLVKVFCQTAAQIGSASLLQCFHQEVLILTNKFVDLASLQQRMTELAVVSLLTTTGSVKVLTWIKSCIMRELALIALVASLRQIELAEFTGVQVHLRSALVVVCYTNLLLKWTFSSAKLLHVRIGQI